ncbi:MAG: ATP synthase gamma chain [Candidatus Wolfebacteria bacterium GW2011_GWB1_47_243]|nr:MAG: ATP synthase gamma chain [Candidatus Wolfebacteria bacterium GW2011_GWB1_47_243]
MEMVSAAKMRRAVSSVLGVRSYAHSAWHILTNLARAFESYQESPFLEVRPVRRVLVVVVSSDRGLCGSFNTQIAKILREELTHPEKLKTSRLGRRRIDSQVEDDQLVVDFITVGKKGEAMVRKLSREIIAAFPSGTHFSVFGDIAPLARIVIEEYSVKRYDKVVVFYTDYVSAVTQQTKMRQILPISKFDIEQQIAEMDILAKQYAVEDYAMEYKVEPSPPELLEYILPKLIAMQLFHAVLESQASEHAARMIAMRNATDAAAEMSGDLTLMYNQIRQGKITQEIAEISAGSAALS